MRFPMTGIIDTLQVAIALNFAVDIWEFLSYPKSVRFLLIK